MVGGDRRIQVIMKGHREVLMAGMLLRKLSLDADADQLPSPRYDPVEQVFPVSDEVMGGTHIQMPSFPVPQIPSCSPDAPPTPPAKDYANGSYFSPPANGQQSRTISTSTGRSITHLSAVDR